LQAKEEIMAKGKWIQGAIKHPGALHSQLGIPQGQKIPQSTLRAAAKEGGKLGKRANLALTLGKMHRGSSLSSYAPKKRGK
jgi:hypothetical protein